LRESRTLQQKFEKAEGEGNETASTGLFLDKKKASDEQYAQIFQSKHMKYNNRGREVNCAVLIQVAEKSLVLSFNTKNIMAALDQTFGQQILCAQHTHIYANTHIHTHTRTHTYTHTFTQTTMYSLDPFLLHKTAPFRVRVHVSVLACKGGMRRIEKERR